MAETQARVLLGYNVKTGGVRCWNTRSRVSKEKRRQAHITKGVRLPYCKDTDFPVGGGER